MKLMKLSVAIAALLLVVVAASSTSQVQPTKAFASELSIDKSMVPVADYCVKTCNTNWNGTKYCGFGGTQIGCHHINLSGNCIFVLCPNPPPPIEE